MPAAITVTRTRMTHRGSLAVTLTEEYLSEVCERFDISATDVSSDHMYLLLDIEADRMLVLSELRLTPGEQALTKKLEELDEEQSQIARRYAEADTKEGRDT